MSPLSPSPVEQINSVRSGEHFVQIYGKDESLAECMLAFFEKGFSKGDMALVIATRAHRAALEAKFEAAGFDIGDLKKAGKYAPFDAAETLGLFMQDGMPEAFRFNALVGGLLKSATKRGSGVRAFGEMVAILWDEGNRAGALELERLWNNLAKVHDFTLFCAYRQDQFASEEERAEYSSVCHAHSCVVGAL